MGLVVNVAMVASALIFLVAAVRVTYVLSTNPVSELTMELLYLRARDLRTPALVILAVLIVEAVQLTFPLLVSRGLIRASATADLASDALQGLLLVVGSVLALRFVNLYGMRALESRISGNLEKIATLQTQKRRVTRLQETDRSDD